MLAPAPVAMAMGTQRAQSDRNVTEGIHPASIAAVGIAPALVLAGPAHADPDVDFANELKHLRDLRRVRLHTWIGEITCKPLYNGIDDAADMSAKFVFQQLPKMGTTDAGVATPRHSTA